jgi:membrane protein
MYGKAAWNLVKQSGTEFVNDRVTRLGAAMAFYTALSLAPLLLVVTGIAGLAFGEQAVRGEIAHQLSDLLGRDQAEAVQAMLAKSASHGRGILATVVGIVTTLVGAIGVFSQLQDALDTVWKAKPDPSRSGVWATIKDQLLSFSMIGVMAFLVLLSLVFGAILSALGHVFERWLPNSIAWMMAGNFLLSLLVTWLMFATIFKILPHARPAWSDVWIGAGITAVLFNLGKYLIGLYLGRASVGSTFGAAGSFVALLMWIYYSAQIVLFGAEFTQVYAMRHGTGEAAIAGRIPADSSGPKVAATADPVI